MNGSLSLVADFNKKLAEVKCDAQVVVCAPSVLLHGFEKVGFSIGAQNVSHLDNGAHTGELSVEMLKEAGCDYVIVGHSERREDQGESNALVAQKAQKSIHPINHTKNLHRSENPPAFLFYTDPFRIPNTFGIHAPKKKRLASCISLKVYLEPKWLRYVLT
mgnify:CR=1 FL=1